MARAHKITVDAARTIRWGRYHAEPERWFGSALIEQAGKKAAGLGWDAS